MASHVEARALAGVGSILVLLALIPSVGSILSIIGWILVLVGVRTLADEYSDSIFNNLLIAVILLIVGIIVAELVVFAAVFQFIGLRSTPMTTQTPTPPMDVFALLGAIMPGLAVVWIIDIVASIFLKRSYDEISLRTYIGTFHTTGLLFLIGAITTIILVGFLIVLVAIILQIVAFFSLPEQAPHGPPQTRTRPPPLPPQTD